MGPTISVAMVSGCWESSSIQWLRRHAEREHDAAQAAGQASTFDPARPWSTVFAKAITDKEWWEDNLHRSVLLYLSRVRTAAQLLDDRTAQPTLDLVGSRSAVSRPPWGFRAAVRGQVQDTLSGQRTARPRNAATPQRRR